MQSKPNEHINIALPETDFGEARILVVGAGGLGNQILKTLVLSGFKKIDVVDYDTLELSNLNRQILFRDQDVGRFKAQVAVERLKSVFPHLDIKAHACRIETLEPSFFSQFNCIISGLDSIEARRWLNSVVVSLVESYLNEDGQPTRSDSTVIPLIDGGTEGWLGHVRIILPGVTACFECTMDCFPPVATVPFCTIIDRPRRPEHCVHYAYLVAWRKERSDDPDLDNQDHLDWLFRKSQERAKLCNIEGVSREATVGILRRIVPSVASTNQVVGAAIVSEAIKTLTGVHETRSNYLFYNGRESSSWGSLFLERKPDCLVCHDDAVVGRSIHIADVFEAFQRADGVSSMGYKDIRFSVNGKAVKSAPEELDTAPAVWASDSKNRNIKLHLLRSR